MLKSEFLGSPLLGGMVDREVLDFLEREVTPESAVKVVI